MKKQNGETIFSEKTRRAVMKSGAIATFLAALTLMALISGTALAQSIDSGCTTNTLYGEYAFRISGQIYGPNGVVAQQRDGVAMTHFDGAGHLTQVDWVMSNGFPLPGPTDKAGFHTSETGKYTVSSDCTGTAEIDFPAPGFHGRGDQSDVRPEQSCPHYSRDRFAVDSARIDHSGSGVDPQRWRKARAGSRCRLL